MLRFIKELFRHPLDFLKTHLLPGWARRTTNGGCPIGPNDREGVVDLDCQVHNYPGLYVADGSTMPGNPGINGSLTIAALAEYAMSRIPAKKN